MKTTFSELHLVIDVSGSMKREAEEGGGGKTRLVQMQSVAANALGRWTGPGRVAAYTCCGSLELIGDGMEAARRGIAGLGEADLGGGTRRWDCLGHLLDMLMRRREGGELASPRVILLTDTGMDESESTRSEVEQRFDKAGVDLSVLACGPEEQEPELESGGKVRVVRLYAEMDDEARRIVSAADAAAFHPEPERRGHVVVACDGKAGLRERVELLHDMAVDYLSGLLRTSYRPVPTVVIDDVAGFLRPRTPLVAPPDPELADDLEEMLSLLHGGCVTVHNALWFLGGKDRTLPAQLGMSDAELEGVRTNTEFQMPILLRALVEPGKAQEMWDEKWRETWKRPDYRIPGIFGPEVRLLDAQVNLLGKARHVLRWLVGRRSLDRHEGHRLRLADFETRRLSRDGKERRGQEVVPYRQDVWRRHLRSNEYAKFAMCFDGRGLLRKDLSSVTTAFEMTLQGVLRLLKRFEEARRRALVQGMRLLGLFMPPASGREEAARTVLAGAGFQGQFPVGESGLVFVCHERCVDLMRQLAPYWPEPRERLLDRILFSVILHEHMHGAMWRCFPRLAARDLAVEESLAEWAEIDACRGGKEEHRRLIGWVASERFQQVVLDHAAGGAFPGWPYQGAALIEEMGRQREDCGEVFRRVLHMHTGAESAKARELLMRTPPESLVA